MNDRRAIITLAVIGTFGGLLALGGYIWAFYLNWKFTLAIVLIHLGKRIENLCFKKIEKTPPLKP